MLGTPLCGALGIEHPILSVGLGALAGPELTGSPPVGGSWRRSVSGLRPFRWDGSRVVLQQSSWPD